MTYENAKNLHNEDEVTVIKTGAIMQVVEIAVFNDFVEVMLEDGSIYHNDELK